MQIDATVTHVRLLVDAYAATFRFYRDLLGLEPTFGDAESGYADFATGDVTLALFDAGEMADAVAGGGGADADAGGGGADADAGGGGADADAGGGGGQRRGRDQVGVVLRVDDVDATAADLRDAGVDLVAPPTDHPGWGIRTVHCRDPDGTLVEFNEPLEG